MTTKVDYVCDYPKTSCMCGMCKSCFAYKDDRNNCCTQDYFIKTEDCNTVNPTNLGVPDCYIDERFNCVNKQWYDSSRTPFPDKCNINILNPNFGITPVPAFQPVNQSGFYPIKCKPNYKLSFYSLNNIKFYCSLNIIRIRPFNVSHAF